MINYIKIKKICLRVTWAANRAPPVGARGNSASDALKGVGCSAWREVTEASNASIDTMLSHLVVSLKAHIDTYTQRQGVNVRNFLKQQPG